MTAADVRDALLARYPGDQYLTIFEAPQGSDRGGRKLDALVVSLWKSRGLAIDGIEIKVSMSDFRRELKEPEKADWWWQRCDRFWIAAPAEIAPKIRAELPPTWGLLACTSKGARQAVAAPRNTERADLGWPTLVGMLRASADAGINALNRERSVGFDQGYEHAKRQPEWGAPSEDSYAVQSVRNERDRLEETISAFEDASGLRLGRYPHHAQRLGALVRLVDQAVIQGPDTIADRLTRQGEQLRAIADGTDQVRTALTTAFADPSVRLGSHEQTEEAPPT
jgi:hypothetical protein